MAAAKPRDEELFEEALDLQSGRDRTAFLDRSCQDAPELRARLERLLKAHEGAERFFADCLPPMDFATPEDPLAYPKSRAATQSQQDPAAKPGEDQVGSQIGSYKLLRKIGEGGCGSVFLAEQESPVRRRVALKVIKLGMDTKSVMARFELERQALALMDHPNIARVLEAGATDTGRPYFVMELINGVRITEYCDTNQCDTRKRLELMIQVCRAIQHAHQKGVLHRDIKPSNILVSRQDGIPVPKIIDFGIAKAIEAPLTERTAFTMCGQIIGTPAYMSPEQAELGGLDVDTRSDIYSLGVVLYELLAGRTPFDGQALMKSGLDEMRRTLREKEPQWPSTVLTTLHGTELKTTAASRRVEPSKIGSLLRGDLDWIVMKALEKDRTRRYETADGLAMDLQRYLNNEPVAARPAGRLYRLQKLVRRNKVVFLAGGAVVAALVAGLASSTWLVLKEQEALREQARLRQAAEQSAERESALRVQAEAREKISQAAMLVTQFKYDEAEQLLNEVKTIPPRPTLDGVSAFRAVGEWLVLQGRWTEASERYSTLIEIDKFGALNTVTLDCQACGIALAESGDFDRYKRFCQDAMANFASTTNATTASRILKTSLLRPEDEEFMASLGPLAEVAEKYYEPLADGPGIDDRAAWGAIAVALWKYRSGDDAAAVLWCQRSLSCATQIPARTALCHTVLAMADSGRGEVEKAQAELAQARELVENKFGTPLERGDARQGFWWDWVLAKMLLNEASGLIGEDSQNSDLDARAR